MSEQLATIFYVLLLVLLVGGVFVFPLYLAWLTWKKNGSRGWAIATLVTTFLCYGLPVGLIGYFKTRKPSGPGASCPECGASALPVSVATRDKETGRHAAGLMVGQIAYYSGSVLLLLSCGLLGYWLISMVISREFDLTPLILIAVPFAVGRWVGDWGKLVMVEHRSGKRFRVVSYQCGQCKHAWEVSDAPMPGSAQAGALGATAEDGAPDLPRSEPTATTQVDRPEAAG